MIKLIQGDCLEKMMDIPSGSVDLVLCDLPYGVTRNEWDSILPLETLWDAYKRLCSLVVLTAAQPFTSMLVMSSPLAFRYELIWEKNIASDFLNAKRKPLKIHENILVFGTSKTYNPQFDVGTPYVQKRSGKDDSGSNYGVVHTRTDTINSGRRYPKTVVRIAREIGLHPTQKPVALMEYLIKTYTNPGDTVLDNCMGSGTTGVACINTGRHFIGIEKDPTYFQLAEDRINDHRQLLPELVCSVPESQDLGSSICTQVLP